MVVLNKALICALYALVNSQYASNMHANKQLVKSENWCLKNFCTIFQVFWNHSTECEEQTETQKYQHTPFGLRKTFILESDVQFCDK